MTAFATADDMKVLENSFSPMLFIIEENQPSAKPHLADVNYGTSDNTLEQCMKPWMALLGPALRIKMPATYEDQNARYVCAILHETDDVHYAHPRQQISQHAGARHTELMRVVDAIDSITAVVVHNSEFHKTEPEKRRLEWFLRAWNSQRTEIIVDRDAVPRMARCKPSMNVERDRLCLCFLMRAGTTCVACK